MMIVKHAAITAIILILLIFFSLFLVVQCQEMRQKERRILVELGGSMIKMSDK